MSPYLQVCHGKFLFCFPLLLYCNPHDIKIFILTQTFLRCTMRYHSWGSPLTSDGFTKPIKQKAPNNLADETTSNRCKDKDTRFVGAGTIRQFDLFNTNEIGNPSGNNLKDDIKDYKAYNSYESNAGAWTLYTRQGIQWLPICKHSKS